MFAVQFIGGSIDGTVLDIDNETWAEGIIFTYELGSVEAAFHSEGDASAPEELPTQTVRYAIRKDLPLTSEGYYRAMKIKDTM